MLNYLKWWLVLVFCLLATGILVPLCTVVVVPTKLLFALLDIAHQKTLEARITRRHPR